MSLLEDAMMMSDDVTDWKILDKLLDSTDIELKTEINNPLAITRLKVLATELERRGMSKASKIIRDFCHDYLLHMASYKRKRSTEIVDGFREILAHNERMKKNDPWLFGGNQRGIK